MKIGLVIYGSLDTVSGGYLYDRMLVEYLRRQGDQVEVIGVPWRNYARHLGDNFSSELFRRLAGLQVDLLIQDELNHPSLFWMNRRIKPHIHYSIVSIVHHLRSSELRPAWQNAFYRRVERSYLNSVGGFVYNSRTTHQVVEQVSAGLHRPALVAYPAGDRLKPDISDFEIEARAEQPGPLRILFLGNLIPRKGLHVLLSALKALAAEDWALQVVGSLEVDRRYATDMQLRVQQSGLAGRVRFMGKVDGSTLADTLNASQVLVVPSSYEGFGIVYLEGMGFGLPAIAGRGGAAGEIISHGREGFLVPAEDPNSLAGCLRLLLNDRRLLAGMGIAARRRYLAHPTWEQTGRAIREFLQDLVNHQG
jgi:glycosyltransferase involved in cell wall biosynthesis